MDQERMDTCKTLAFISLIQDRPEIWRKENRDFMNNEKRAKLLSEIADAVGVSEKRCKKKLKGLKDKMRVIVNKLPRPVGGQPDLEAAVHFIRWPFYKHMLFMADELLKKEASSNISQPDPQALKEESLSSLDHESDGDSLTSLELNRPEQAMEAPTATLPHRPKSTRVVKESLTKKARSAEKFPSLDRLNDLKTLFGDHEMHVAEKTRTPQDESQFFCDAIAFDLRKLRDPALIMRTKTEIYSIVNKAVVEQVRLQLREPVSAATDQGIVLDSRKYNLVTTIQVSL